MNPAVRVGVLTVSDGVHAGTREDLSGRLILNKIHNRGYVLADATVVPDDSSAIVSRLINWSDCGEIDCIITTGGTGLGARDVTPEATRVVLERIAPGIAERFGWLVLNPPCSRHLDAEWQVYGHRHSL